MNLTFSAHDETDQIPYSKTHAAQENSGWFLRRLLVERLDCHSPGVQCDFDDTFFSDSSAVRLVLVKYAIRGRRLLYAQVEGLVPTRTRCPLFHSGGVALFVVHSDDRKHIGVGLYHFCQ